MMMARGLLVVDESLSQLVAPLTELGIRVIEPLRGESDQDIAQRLLPGRIFLTRNIKDFARYAYGMEFGIISLDGLDFVDPQPDESKNLTVKIILNALLTYELWSKRNGFILELKDDGNHVYKEF
jgi:hypothetical protein